MEHKWKELKEEVEANLRCLHEDNHVYEHEAQYNEGKASAYQEVLDRMEFLESLHREMVQRLIDSF